VYRERRSKPLIFLHDLLLGEVILQATSGRFASSRIGMSRAIQISEVILKKISGRFAQGHVGMLRTKVAVLEVVV